MFARISCLALLAMALVSPPLYSQNTQAPAEVAVFDLRPGKTVKAEVDLRLGEPLRKIDAEVELPAYDYAPPREAPEAERLRISYFRDTWQVARLDVRLKVPISADVLRDQFGTRVITRDIALGREEIYYPRLQALILTSNAADAPVSGVSYLSQRWLADHYADRFDEHLRTSNQDEARFAAEKAVIIAPQYARGYVCQGILYSKQNNHAEARIRFQAGVNATSGPNAKAVARLWLARWYLEQAKQIPEAEAEYRKATEEAPALPEAYVRYGQFLVKQKRPADAIAALKKAVDLEPDNMETRRSFADVLRQQRRYQDEYPHLKALYEWAESGGTSDFVLRAKILRRYAQALWPGRNQPDRFAFGNAQQALEIYAKAAEIDTQDVWAVWWIGEIHRELGDPARAVAVLRSGLQRDPKSVDLHRGLGMALLESGRYSEAREVAEASVSLNPESAPTQMVQVARAWSALRDKKHTFLWLNKAADAGYKDREYLTTDRFLAAFRDKGDFQKLLDRMR